MTGQIRLVVWLCILALAVQGCARQPKMQGLTDRQFARLGTMAVVSARFDPQMVVIAPAAGKLAGAGRKSAQWAARGFVAPIAVLGHGHCTGSICGAVVVLTLGVAVASGTVGGIVGGVVGAVEAQSADQIRQADAALKDAIAKMQVQQEMRNTLITVLRSRTQDRPAGYSFVYSEVGPGSKEEIPDYTYLARQGVDSVLEVAVLAFGLTGDWDADPPLSSFMKGRLRIVSTKGNEELFRAEYTCPGETHHYSEWAADNARKFGGQFAFLYQCLAGRLADQLRPSVSD